MPVNEVSDLVLNEYNQTHLAVKPESLFDGILLTHILRELKEIQSTLQSLSDATIQATDNPPATPRRGMVRYNVLPWNPLSNNSQGLVVYNGSAWVAV